MGNRTPIKSLGNSYSIHWTTGSKRGGIAPPLKEIQQKYGVNSIEELKALVDKAQSDYVNKLDLAKQYIEDTKQALSKFNGIM